MLAWDSRTGSDAALRGHLGQEYQTHHQGLHRDAQGLPRSGRGYLVGVTRKRLYAAKTIESGFLQCCSCAPHLADGPVLGSDSADSPLRVYGAQRPSSWRQKSSLQTPLILLATVSLSAESDKGLERQQRALGERRASMERSGTGGRQAPVRSAVE